jgi:hypothetical protein
MTLYSPLRPSELQVALDQATAPAVLRKVAIAWSAVVGFFLAFGGSLVGLFLQQASPVERVVTLSIAIPTALLLLGAAVVRPWLLHARQARRFARLRGEAAQLPANGIRFLQVPGRGTPWWAAIVDWQDARGERRETVAGPFDYDPGTVDPATIRVFVDPRDPARSIVVPETLPPLERPTSSRTPMAATPTRLTWMRLYAETPPARMQADARLSGVLLGLFGLIPIGAGILLVLDGGNDAGGDARTGAAFAIGFGLLAWIPIPLQWRQSRRQARRYAHLQRHGVRRPAEAARTEHLTVSNKRDRWGVIVTWRDGLGRAHETVAGPYAYDPAPLDPTTLAVLADRENPARSIVAPDTLPGFERSSTRGR